MHLTSRKTGRKSSSLRWRSALNSTNCLVQNSSTTGPKVDFGTVLNDLIRLNIPVNPWKHIIRVGTQDIKAPGLRLTGRMPGFKRKPKWSEVPLCLMRSKSAPFWSALLRTCRDRTPSYILWQPNLKPFGMCFASMRRHTRLCWRKSERITWQN